MNWPISHGAADEPFVELTIEGLGPEREQEPNHHDIVTGTRMLPLLLRQVNVTAMWRDAYSTTAELDNKDVPEEVRPLFVDMDVEAFAGRERNMSRLVHDLARNDSLVLTPPVATMAVSGLHRIAATHGPVGRLRFGLLKFRLDNQPYQNASALYERPTPEIREGAIQALRSLQENA